jgi:phosphoribosyl 1,2-cyclic phosphodiesterase
LRLVVLGSGSGGNAAFLEAGVASCRGDATPTRVLIDAGLSKREIARRLAARRCAPLDAIDAVVITHDHGDHAAAARRLGRPVFATAATAAAAGVDAAHTLVAGTTTYVGAVAIHAVALPHDAEDAIGVLVSDGETTIGLLTDCGHPDPRLARAFAGCDVLVLETNHEPSLLRSGPYPYSLKRRIAGPHGHLSNAESARLLQAILDAGPPPRVVVAAHLSETNNRPMLAKRALERVVGKSARVVVATQTEGAPAIAVDGTRLTVEPLPREQLAFAFEIAS